MPNQKISGFDDLTTAGITISDVVGVAAYYDNGGTLTNVRFSGNEILQDLDSVLAQGDTAVNKDIVLSDGGFNQMTLDLDGLNRNNAGNFTWSGNGLQIIENTGSAAADYIRIQTAGGPGQNPSILINSRSPGTGKLKLKTATEIQVDLPTPPSVGDVLSAKNVNGDIEWVTPSTGGFDAFTTLTAADVIDWDYATDGPNIKVTLGAGLENVLTVDTTGEFPDGSSGWLVIDPSLSTDYKLPSETNGSAATMASLITNGDPSLGGSNKVLFHWVYDVKTFFWTKFENMIDPIYPPSVVFDSTNLIAFYHPESYNESVNGAPLVVGQAVPEISASSLIGDLAIGSNVTNAEFYTRDDSVSRPAFWSLGGDSNSILSPSTFAGQPVTNTVSCYIQGPFAASYSTIFDFDEGSGYQELLYINSSREFEFDYSPAITLGFPALEDYTATGGADLSTEWIFISCSLDDAANEVIFYAGCQSSLDAAVAAGGATNWDYDGLGNTIAVDANGLYKETNAFTIGTNTFDRFFYGQSVGGVSEGAKCHLGMLGIYSAVLNDAQVTQNWLDSRPVYYIS